MTSADNNGLGFHSMWGFSPCRNPLHFLPQSALKSESNDPINILMVQPCDPRNVLPLLAQQKNTNRPINIYIYEPQAEIIARHILLLYIFLDTEKDIPIRQRVALFLEVFGNSLIRKRTESYIEQAAKTLQDWITLDQLSTNDGKHHLQKMIDWTHLKQRERDKIDDTFKSWRMKNMNFDIKNLRDYRLRGYYRERYDCRKNILEWDYHNRVKEVASIIHIKQYREWRMSGIAFEFGDATYTEPNRTTSSFTQGVVKAGKDRGLKKEVQGYWLDILVGPFVSFGVEVCKYNSDKEQEEMADTLFHVTNKGTGAAQHRHHTVEVATYNLLQMMWELETGKAYKIRQKDNIFSGLGETMKENAKIEIISDEAKLHTTAEKKKKFQLAASMSNIRIIPISGNFTSNIVSKKTKYLHYFNHISVSQQAIHLLKQNMSFKTLLKQRDATVSIETNKFIFPLTTEKKFDEMAQKLISLAEGQGLKLADKSRDNILSNADNLCFNLQNN